jgi:OOP family OmpA-OmpF porin
MKKLLLLSAVSAALSINVQAQEKASTYDQWVGGFLEYYSTDHAETGSPDFIDNGMGVGLEYGFKFAPEWAARIELSHLDVDAEPANKAGNRFGVDALYFMSDELFYAFGGLKVTHIRDSDVMANIGLGKHWDANESVRIITEIAGYKGLGSDSNTHFGVKVGLAYTFGGKKAPAMPKDSDGDGVNDNIDQCANTPAGTQVDSVGCSLDTDNDGVLNTVDKCANTPAGTKVGAKGCSLVLDADQDGVLDDKDNCAETPMTDKVDATGCSVFMEEEVSTNLQVLFGNNSSIVSNPNDPQFAEFAKFMERFPATDTVIEGHASANGDDNYNMMISKKRAESVRTLLINTYGIDAARITAVGFGETQLLDTSNTAEAHKINRRITAKVSASKKVKVQR